MGALAGDTCSISHIALKEERSALGKAAFRMGFKSVGELIRTLIVKGAELEDPELANQLRKARKQRYVVNATVLLVGCTAVFQATFGHSKIELRKPRVARESMRQVVRRELEPSVA